MNFCTDYKLERYLLNTQWEQLPQSVQNRALVCSIDLMTALMLGAQGEQFRCGQRLARHMQGGILPVPGTRETYGLLGAATVMGHASNSFDIDDGHNMIKGHPGTSFIGGLLAAAADRQVTYKEYLTAMVVCYDAAVRMGLALQDHYGFLHSTGAYGAVATAAAVGRILELDEKQLNTALSMAEFHAPMVPVMRAVEYPSMNKDGVPFGAMVGMLAVLDTLAGETARTHLLELPEYQPLLNTLGQVYEIENLYFKPYTCCRWAHQPIQAAVELMTKEGFTHEDVAAVTVYTFSSAAKLSKRKPGDTDEAQYNIAWPVASAIVHGDVGFRQVCNDALQDTQVLSMMDRLSFVVDPELDAQFPEKRLARVEFTLTNGKTLSTAVYAADGEAADHVDMEWMERKFRRITAPILSRDRQDRVLAILKGSLEQKVPDMIRKINDLLFS